MYVCWSVKGGSGTTVVAAALALLHAESRPTIVVDLGGDLPATLGMAEPGGPGVSEWLRSPAADQAGLLRLAEPVGAALHVLPRGNGPLALGRWPELVDALGRSGHEVVVDAGMQLPPDQFGTDAISLLVTRACYLALRRAAQATARPTGVIVLSEPGRVLSARDIEHTVGAPVVAQIPWDPAVARAVDAGLLATRVPVSLQQTLRRAA